MLTVAPLVPTVNPSLLVRSTARSSYVRTYQTPLGQPPTLHPVPWALQPVAAQNLPWATSVSVLIPLSDAALLTIFRNLDFIFLTRSLEPHPTTLSW